MTCQAFISDGTDDNDLAMLCGEPGTALIVHKCPGLPFAVECWLCKDHLTLLQCGGGGHEALRAL